MNKTKKDLDYDDNQFLENRRKPSRTYDRSERKEYKKNLKRLVETGNCFFDGDEIDYNEDKHYKTVC